MPDKKRRERAVKFIIKSRTNRKNFFPPRLFSDPAWDMLLRLYAGAVDRQTLPLTVLAEAAEIGLPAAARWVEVLEAEDLIAREASPDEDYEEFALSERGWFAMDSYFENMSSGMI